MVWSSLVMLHRASKIALSACLPADSGVLQWMGLSLLLKVASEWFGRPQRWQRVLNAGHSCLRCLGDAL